MLLWQTTHSAVNRDSNEYVKLFRLNAPHKTCLFLCLLLFFSSWLIVYTWHVGIWHLAFGIWIQIRTCTQPKNFAIIPKIGMKTEKFILCMHNYICRSTLAHSNTRTKTISSVFFFLYVHCTLYICYKLCVLHFWCILFSSPASVGLVSTLHTDTIFFQMCGFLLLQKRSFTQNPYPVYMNVFASFRVGCLIYIYTNIPPFVLGLVIIKKCVLHSKIYVVQGHCTHTHHHSI